MLVKFNRLLGFDELEGGRAPSLSSKLLTDVHLAQFVMGRLGGFAFHADFKIIELTRRKRIKLFQSLI